MSQIAELTLDGKKYEFPIIEGSEQEKAIDISKLRDQTGYITIDPGYKNTGATKSAITFLDGEEGVLNYRGYSIEDLAEKSSFLEVAYLLIYGELPTEKQFAEFEHEIRTHTLVNEDMRKIFEGFPVNAHPMGVLSSLVSAMSAFYPDANAQNSEAETQLHIIRLLAKLPTIATWSYKKSQGHPVNYPQNELDYCSNFLNMMFSLPVAKYNVDPVVSAALNKLLILHADHEQNCSTSTVRLVGSSHANIFSSISSGISALWGPLHGGANQEVIEMLEAIKADGGDTQKYINMAKDKSSGFRLFGFGHRVYKNFDPRARIIKKAADDVLNKLGINDPVLEIAQKLEKAALEDDYFVQRKLYPNVDFYSGIIYRALGIPTNMFTVMFAIGRLPGWIAQWKEMRVNKEPIGRPRQIYTGAPKRDFVPMSERK
ncbi:MULTISPECIES: citrate synthase [Dyadobacter]|jgi:citrate synthase|uniref:Citrate synthase n=2 Tax=Dyadobacter TaxID=120831 RepID=A0A2P8G9A6_9BACT|nr:MULTISPECIES: citrate synthase [Dyadobacter]MBO9615130.1 citrate synthase [Dyadobacter sp.]MBZ1362222.1 citrate synthase [Dyadobacter fermentans]MDR6806540.1 citrate synthase [Dyadobacter fermentans]MDR7044281.1 citrate synthase [Dyadobacter sp. BE242]MDR7198592.1 citrate synthase [Dyadobacter sp. BE34]